MINCQNCPHALFEQVNPNYAITDANMRRYNIRCGKVIFVNNVVDYYAKKNDVVKSPTWCPLPKEHTDLIKKSLKPVAWDEIHVNDVFHIPPILGKPRREIKVIFKNNQFLSYQLKTGETFVGNSNNYLNRYDIECYVMMQKRPYTSEIE